MEKNIRENQPNQAKVDDLPVKRKQATEKPEFIDDHVPGNHGAMEKTDGERNDPDIDRSGEKSY